MNLVTLRGRSDLGARKIPWTGKSNVNRKFALTFLFLGADSSPSDMLQGMFAACSSACAGPL